MAASDSPMASAFPKESHTCVSEILELFDKPNQPMEIEDRFTTRVFPNGAISDAQTTISFDVQPSENMLDFSESKFKVGVKILDEDGKALPALSANHGYGLEQSAGSTLFSAINVLINGTPITSNYNNQPYISYLATLLNYNDEFCQTVGATWGYYPEDDLANLDSVSQHSGLARRALRTAASTETFFLVPLFNDLATCQRLLLSMTPIHIDFQRSRAPFCIRAQEKDKKFQLKITWLTLELQYVRVDRNVLQAIERQLEEKDESRNKAIYPILHQNVRNFTIGPGVQNYQIENCFSSDMALPTQVVLGIVDSEAYNGSTQSSPFFFQRADVRNVYVCFDGTVLPLQPYNINWKTDYEAPYQALYSDVPLKYARSGCFISRHRFRNNGYCLYRFNLPNYQPCDQLMYAPKKAAPARIVIEFNRPTTKTLMLMVYYSRVELLYLSKNRGVTMTYAL